MKAYIAITAILLIVSAPLCAQEFAYVTDSLQLRVYTSSNDSSEILQSIESGDSVEVFESENGFSKVTTLDGTVGWVKSAFLVTDPPAKLLYYSVGEKNKELEAEIEALKSEVQNNSSVSTPTGSSDEDLNQIKELQAQLSQQQQNNQALQKQLDEKAAARGKGGQTFTDTYTVVDKNLFKQIISSKKWWFVGATAALLLAGLLLGVKISAWRLRKRLHGFRI